MRPETVAARGGRAVESASRPLTPPIYQSSVFVFEDLTAVDAVWEGKRDGFVYGRFGTPNHAMLEQLVATLEGAEGAVASASGMGATTAVLSALLEPGDGLVASRDLYGSTLALLREEGRRLGIETSFVDGTDTAAVLAACGPRTRAVYVEALSNPLLRLADIGALAGGLAVRGIRLIVDASFASPAVLRPLAHGASLVVHSATKFLSGHGDVTAGVVAGPRADIERVRASIIRMGASLGPFDAWLCARGLRTLYIRMARQCENAERVSGWLEAHPAVGRVHYPGLATYPQRALAKSLLPRLAGAVVSCELAGGRPAVEAMMRRLRLVEFAPSFGDVATTWSYPAATSHRGLAEAERRALGVTEGLVRLSVGVEAVEDVIEDLAGALAG
jgi:cystathionine beta-lyase/cystathionine gamma-synthase